MKFTPEHIDLLEKLIDSEGECLESIGLNCKICPIFFYECVNSDIFDIDVDCRFTKHVLARAKYLLTEYHLEKEILEDVELQPKTERID